MSRNGDANNDRWQELMKSMDPVANLNLVADLWKQAAESSDRVVAGSVGRRTDDQVDGPETGPRDVRRDIERAVDQMGEAAKQLFGQVPWVSPIAPSGPPLAEIAVADGVGTTEITIPAADGRLWTAGAVSHDGASIAADAITFWPSADPNAEGPATDDEPGERSYIIKVTVDSDTGSGLYHGQILIEGEPDFLLIYQVKVVSIRG
jgi:hypothetical protein